MVGQIVSLFKPNLFTLLCKFGDTTTNTVTYFLWIEAPVRVTITSLYKNTLEQMNAQAMLGWIGEVR